MDSEAGSVSGTAQEVAGFHRPVRHLSKSPLFSIFFSLPRSERSGNGCSSSELEWVAGVCLSSLVSNSSGAEEAPVVLWGPADHHSPLLASEAVVARSSGSGGGRSSGSSSVQRPSSPTPLPPLPSGGVQAVASCLETIQRFARARGFSKHVAQQVALASRPSLRAGYQTRWLVYRRWCRAEGHSISGPSLAKIADFYFLGYTKYRESIAFAQKIDFHILINLHVLRATESKKVIFGMSSVCLSVATITQKIIELAQPNLVCDLI